MRAPDLEPRLRHGGPVLVEHTLWTLVPRAAGLGTALIEALRLALLVVLVELLGVGVGAERVSGAHSHYFVLLKNLLLHKRTYQLLSWSITKC